MQPAIIVFASLLAAAALTFVSNTASAQAYPGKSIRLIVPWPPGGGTDAAGRIMAQALSDGLSGPVVVENRPPQTIGERLRHDAPGGVRPPARRPGHDQPDRLAGICLGGRGIRNECQRGGCKQRRKYNDCRLHGPSI